MKQSVTPMRGIPQVAMTITLMFVILALALTACAGPQVREKDLQIESLRLQVKALQEELENRRRREEDQTVQFQRELDAERKTVNELKAELRGIRPPLEGEAMSVNELVAVPEEYLGKEVVAEGRLMTVTFHDPGGNFVLRGDEGQKFGHNLECYFRAEDLDPNSRRLLAAAPGYAKMRVSGRLIRAANGIANEMGIRSRSGYAFHVKKIEY
jgi:hypothetical protein